MYGPGWIFSSDCSVSLYLDMFQGQGTLPGVRVGVHKSSIWALAQWIKCYQTLC